MWIAHSPAKCTILRHQAIALMLGVHYTVHMFKVSKTNKAENKYSGKGKL
jgi:hypothetical protein